MESKAMTSPTCCGMGLPSMRQEMTEKMMGGMGECNPMAMCQAMLTSVSKPAEMAAVATPEIRTLFEEWGQKVEREMLALLTCRGPLSLEALAGALKMSQASAVCLLGKLVEQGRATIGDVRATAAGPSA